MHGGPQFTHTAWDDHRLLFDVLAGRAGRGRKDRLIPYTAYTDPQVAGVGLTEREAKAKGVRYEVATLPFKVLEQLYQHPLTDIGLDKFLADWRATGRGFDD